MFELVFDYGEHSSWPDNPMALADCDWVAERTPFRPIVPALRFESTDPAERSLWSIMKIFFGVLRLWILFG